MTAIRTTLVLAGTLLPAVLLAAGTAQAQITSQIASLSGNTTLTGQWQCCRAGALCAATTITSNAVAGTTSASLAATVNTLFNGNAAFTADCSASLSGSSTLQFQCTNSGAVAISAQFAGGGFTLLTTDPTINGMSFTSTAFLPSLTEWGLITLVLFGIGGGGIVLARRRQAAAA
jgi:hypothetical protein